ncbi:hypothetical protein K4K49_003766 [Colletotrichum sp. SAR 10_70]|nr:hypothetical protein K4K50_006699 [Colletotrichum sp. SAR 10_71]KAI8167372.1 hypothetical protein KHU50_006575 [Colletotrichum sp. SAR 10_65]KAI8190695.1 hypothetical protein K4K51_001065 [Colletotrichum sp. SAR 10_75]KAI8204331.1 hypothetical protein K4K49_003766 [Colletotrichum sp. SAR 10_70]KAI8219289.1 hypothetical protein K4K54_009610 [Colletotrichum sp. SAR 10_86]KAI8263766.1 hypothetical protein K4K53_006160 [Colletotrichum sp. SAR 10_77]KAJ5001747.1 hypothetical protein K4K48_00092
MAAIRIAPQRIDDLDEEILDERLNYIASIHCCLENDFPDLMDMHNNYDLRSPHDTSRPELYTYRQILNQVRYWSTFLSLPMKRLRKIHKKSNRQEDGEGSEEFNGSGLFASGMAGCAASPGK